ncbi:lytic transglycosylase domain-containing protein [Hoyosella sp. YIM 151337]|uniref:lytic transglycosylase domain-containing protein n=1 Tax=Hoyosella sp. YIM 151337 TaxID=2992742 RepID=UPI0022356E74|nr:lytic transglycosylase domain-containing protein [Hoyosella sp. YIM 151337]MCW4353586.1 lytic transglycosylase domain-containing protein [Hoyosella sp. YIM 151337]
MRRALATMTVLAGAAALAVSCGGFAQSPDYYPRTASSGFNEEFQLWIAQSADQCDAITPAILAAQIEAESSFRTDALSPRGAMGPAQFIPETWEIWGVDADGDGVADPYSIPDAVMSQGAFMCDNHRRAVEGIDAGVLQGDPLDLALAAYNAGFGAVQRAGGMPAGGEYTSETRPYVDRIRDREAVYLSLG